MRTNYLYKPNSFIETERNYYVSNFYSLNTSTCTIRKLWDLRLFVYITTLIEVLLES